MKRVLALILCVLTVLSLTACAPKEEELGPEVVEKKDFSKFSGIVEGAQAWYDAYMALPIANDQMTEKELRQLCVDTFRLNMTMPWTPNVPVSYTYTLLNRSSEVNLPIGLAYSGLCYATGIQNATYGNIWKMLPYWDVETGVLDVEAMGNITMNSISSACAAGAQQGWNRISATSGIIGMESYSMYESNIVPVGDYTYTPETYNNYFVGSRTASNEIIAANGEEVMYESLAKAQPADGLFSSSSWHVMMVSQDPVVVRMADGKVDPFQSYVYVHEQGSGGTQTDKYNYIQENGKTHRPLGTVDNKYTFEKLISSGYIPFTLKEFIGQEPVVSGKAWLGTQVTSLPNGMDITASLLFTHNLYTNFNLCNVKVEVKSPDGTVLVSYYPQIMTGQKSEYHSLQGGLETERVAPYANGKNTIHIYARLTNGELIEVFNTILKMQ